MAFKIQKLSIDEKAKMLREQKAEAEANLANSKKKKKTRKSSSFKGAKKKSPRIQKSWICGFSIGDTVKERFDDTTETITGVDVISVGNIPNVEVLYFNNNEDDFAVAAHYSLHKKTKDMPPPEIEGDSISLDDIPF